MKQFITSMALMVSLICTNATANIITTTDIQDIATKIYFIQAQNSEALVNWKVGDAQEYNVNAGMGFSGSLKKLAFQEEGNGIWVKQDLDLGFTKDNSEMLIDRNSGAILKFRHNGQPAEVPKNDMEITEMENSTVSVPGYSGKALHVTGKSKDISRFEAWINNEVISLDGSAKIYVEQSGMKITMELTKFTKK